MALVINEGNFWGLYQPAVAHCSLLLRLRFLVAFRESEVFPPAGAVLSSQVEDKSMASELKLGAWARRWRAARLRAKVALGKGLLDEVFQDTPYTFRNSKMFPDFGKKKLKPPRVLEKWLCFFGKFGLEQVLRLQEHGGTSKRKHKEQAYVRR